MKSGLPFLKTTLADAWTHNQHPVLVSSLKKVKPLFPVFITEDRGHRGGRLRMWRRRRCSMCVTHGHTDF